jgi:uncharacterized protein
MEKKHPEFEKAEVFILAALKDGLSPLLSYHNMHHTFDVLEAAMKIAAAEKIPSEDMQLLRVAVLFHDAGFIHTYRDHENKGCEMAKEYLPSFQFSDQQIDMICGMIQATKIPQDPLTKLEEVIADADLDYLGRDDVFSIAQTLFDEFKIHGLVNSPEEWDPFQLNFLKQHRYHTAYSIKLREPAKQLYMQALMKKIS